MSSQIAEVKVERALYVGIVTSAVLYGVYLGFYCLSVCALFSNTNTTQYQRSFYIIFGCILLLLNTIFFLSQSYMGQLIWITMRNSYPGGSYLTAKASNNHIFLLGDAAQNLAIALNDGLLIYRCYVIFSTRLYVSLLPTLCALGALALGMATIPSYLPSSPKINATGICLNTITNIMITSMISIRILAIARSVRKSTQSRKKQSRTYINAVAILVESAAPCAILGVMTCVMQFMISDGSSSTFLDCSSVIYLLWSVSIALSPHLIIYRIARGRVWTSTTHAELTQTTGVIGSTNIVVAISVSGTDHLS